MSKISKKLFKQVIALLLVITMMIPLSAPIAYGATPSSGDATIEEFLAWNIYMGEAMVEFNRVFGVDFSEIMEIFEGVQVSEEWIEDALQFIEDIIDEYSDPRTRSSDDPNDFHDALGVAVGHSIAAADAAVRRNPRLDLGRESQFMFISHFIDRPQPFFVTRDTAQLRDGPAQRNNLAHRITTHDRNQYERYIWVSGFGSAIQAIGNTAYQVRSLYRGAQGIRGAVTMTSSTGRLFVATSTSSYSTYLAAKDLYDNFMDNARVVRDWIVMDQCVETIAINLWESFAGTDFMDEATRKFLVNTILGVVFSAAMKTTAGLAFGIGLGAAMVMFNIYMNFFQQAAWLTHLRQTFNGRMAQRNFYYFFGWY